MKQVIIDKKVMFVIQPHSIIDVITNSSSELFVFEGKEREAILEMIKSVYPEYLNEYYELRSIEELSTNDLDLYVGFAAGSRMWPAKKENYKILNGFTFEELYEPKKDYKTDEIEEPAWNGEIQYELKHNGDYSYVTDENKEWVINKLSPNKDMYFLFSKDDNPNWDYQEKLEMFGQRIHLG